jgi:hypothetical protein
VPEELVHSELAQSFAATGHFHLRDVPFPARTWGPLYLVLIAPAFRIFGSLPDAYVAVKAINSLLMSCAAVPAYLLARRLLTRQWALVLSVLAVLAPSAIYASKVTAESLAYPVFLFAVLAMVYALEHCTWRRELLVFGAIGVAVLSRAQLAVLFPAFVATVAIGSFLDVRDVGGGGLLRPFVSRICRYRITVATATLFALLLAAGKALGIAPSSVTGGHREAFGSVGASVILKLFVLQLAELDLYLTFLPLVAAALVSIAAFKRGSSLRKARPFCVLTLVVSCFMLALSSRYLAAVYSGSFLHAYDRYIFYVAPLFLILFLFWSTDGAARPRSSVVWLLPAFLLPLMLASTPLLAIAWGNPSTVGLAPWSFIRLAWGAPAVYIAMVLTGAYLCWAFLRARDPNWLVMLVLANFLIINLFVTNASLATARAAERNWIGPGVPGDWIDRAVGRTAHVSVLWSGLELQGTRGWHRIWEAELLNRSVGGVYDLREGPPYALPEPRLQIRGRRLFLAGEAFRAEYVLSDQSTPVVGQAVAFNRRAGLTVYRVSGAVELAPAAAVLAVGVR